MKEIIWNLVLQKPELNEYLAILDIVQLSLVNKLIRERLKLYLFSMFNIVKYFNEEYRVMIEKNLEEGDNLTKSSILDVHLNKFKLSLLNLSYKQFIKGLKYNEKIPLKFINLSLLEVFPSLTRLEFTRVKIPYGSLLNIFKNSKNLCYLNLQLIGIIKLKNDNFSPSDLKFPSSLITIKFGWLDIIISKVENYPNVWNYDYISDIEAVREIYINPQYLPNLENFQYFPQISSSLTQNSQSFLEFLKLNKNLKNLETLPKYFDKEIISEISKANRLTKVKLGHFLKFSKLPDTSFAQINSITNLSLDLDFIGRVYFEKLCKLFPNVEILSLNCHYHSQQLFTSILANFSKLVKLSIKSKEGIPTTMFNSTNLPHVKAITLYSECYSQYQLSDFDKLSNLNRITIEWKYVRGFGDVFLEEHYNKFINWKYYLRLSRIQCYKI